MDPIEIFKRITNNKKKILINYKNPIHKEYLNRRKKLLEVLQNLSILENFDEETYFQTLFFLDKCILKENFSSLLDNKLKNIPNKLSKINEEKRLDYDYLFLTIVLGCFSLSSKNNF